MSARCCHELVSGVCEYKNCLVTNRAICCIDCNNVGCKFMCVESEVYRESDKQP